MLGWQVRKFYNAFLQAQQGTEINKKTTILLTRLDAKRKERWLETVNFIDFMHSNRLAWNSINRFTGRSSHSHRKWPISCNAIASQLVTNGTQRMRDREFVTMEICDLWRVSKRDAKKISANFSSEKSARRKSSMLQILESRDRRSFIFSCLQQLCWRITYVFIPPKGFKLGFIPSFDLGYNSPCFYIAWSIWFFGKISDFSFGYRFGFLTLVLVLVAGKSHHHFNMPNCIVF